jgi:hypothetical protein
MSGLKMAKKRLILAVILMLQIIPLVYASDSPTTINFTHTTEYYRDFYFVYDSISIEGSNFEPDRNYSISLLKDITLTNNMAIPERPSGTTTMIASDSDGNVATTEIWSQFGNIERPYLSVGEYHIVVDVDYDGVYTEEVDVVDSTTIRPGIGTFRVESEGPQFQTPEFPGGSITAILAFLAAMFLIRSRKIALLPKIS